MKVETSQWGTPVVPIIKNNNSIRLCGDYKVTVNPNLIVDEHPLPTIEHIFAKVSDGVKYSKIDLSRAYLQVQVDPQDQEILTWTTHKGLFRPTRLMFGISSAPAIWQRLIEMILVDVPGIAIYLDDIVVTDSNDSIHLERLDLLFKTLQKWNIKVNFEKCSLFQDSIEYCGFRIDKQGIHKMRAKIMAMVDMAEPENKDQVKALRFG